MSVLITDTLIATQLIEVIARTTVNLIRLCPREECRTILEEEEKIMAFMITDAVRTVFFTQATYSQRFVYMQRCNN